MNYDLRKYDFLDLGSKKGGSIDFCSKRFGSKGKLAKGIGVDINPEHVENARKAGYDSIQKDIFKLKMKHKFKFVSAMDFLEHMPSIDDAEKVIKKISGLASDFLFIRHPSFDDVEYLKQLGLKITWTDWSVHSAMMKTYDFTRMLNGLGLKQYCFIYNRDLVDSNNKVIIPLKSPINTLEYSKKLGRKKFVKFEKKVFSSIDIYVALRPIEAKEWAWITREN